MRKCHDRHLLFSPNLNVRKPARTIPQTKAIKSNSIFMFLQHARMFENPCCETACIIITRTIPWESRDTLAITTENVREHLFATYSASVLLLGAVGVQSGCVWSLKAQGSCPLVALHLTLMRSESQCLVTLWLHYIFIKTAAFN